MDAKKINVDQDVKDDLNYLAGIIFTLDPAELITMEHRLNKGKGTSPADTAVIRLSQLVRRIRPEILEIEQKMTQKTDEAV